MHVSQVGRHTDHWGLVCDSLLKQALAPQKKVRSISAAAEVGVAELPRMVAREIDEAAARPFENARGEAVCDLEGA